MQKNVRLIQFLLLAFLSGLRGADPPVEIPLPSPFNQPELEYSALAWYRDYLILLPQYPTGYIVALSRPDIASCLENPAHPPVQPIRVPFLGDEFKQLISGFEGFEAILIEDTLVTLMVEINHGHEMSALAIQGQFPSLEKGISLDPSRTVEIMTPRKKRNMAYESLISVDGQYIPLYEANGARVNEDPWQPVLGPDLQVVDKIPFPTIEYRITDATDMDETGKFWVINYLWPGDYRLLKPAPDPFLPGGKAVKPGTAVERLLEMEYRDNHIFVTPTPPLNIPPSDSQSRNWEGIARYGDQGFIIITDKHPRTILLFVPWPDTTSREDFR